MRAATRSATRPPTTTVPREDTFDLSLVIPCFNEALRLQSSLVEVGHYLAAQPYASEIVLVDDGSSDRSFEVACELAAELPVPITVARYAPNRGKGHALKVAFELTCGGRILFCDADLSTPIEETARFMAALDDGAALAIGSRRMPGAQVDVHQPWLRERMGKVFTALARRLAADVSDTTCGFKAFQGDVGRALFELMRIDDWSFDAELLLLARLAGHRIYEVPVRWHDEADTKVKLLRAALESLFGLLRIRWNLLRGVYRSVERVGVRPEIRRFEPRRERERSRQASS